MKTAALYVRVSTDEQGEYGHSLQVQETLLKRYCSENRISVLAVFIEKFSAWESFDRPAYNNLKSFLQSNKGKVNYVLCVHWSRFSRNVTAGLEEVKRLQKVGIEPNAISQWVDHRVPESLISLVIYLAQPQIENDRLSRRVREVCRQKRLEGRWMGKAPLGYLNNKIDKTIEIDSESAELVKYVFSTFATGLYSAEDVRKLAIQKGLKMKKQGFLNLLSNRFYIGSIVVPEFDDDPEIEVPGLHNPIIDLETFQRVQWILKNRRKPYQGKTKSDELPLSGYIICPVCNKAMTGSGSTGNGGVYHYYHCQKNHCKTRYKAKQANFSFIEYLNTFSAQPAVIQLYYKILMDVFKSSDEERMSERRNIESKIRNIEAVQEKLIGDYYGGELSAPTFESLKKRNEELLNALIIQHATLNCKSREFERQLSFAMKLIQHLGEYYETASTFTKRRLIGSIFPENLSFDGTEYRTTKINEVFSIMTMNNNDLKKKQPAKNSRLSTQAPPSGLEPETL